MAPKSGVWDFFLKESRKEVRCKQCTTIINYCGNTTNLWNHLKTKHGTITSTPTAHKTKPKSGSENTDPDEPPAIPAQGSSKGSRDPERDVLGPLPLKRLCTLDDTWKRASSYSASGERTAELNDALTFMVCRDHMPLCTPEREGFRYFAKKAVPLWKLPCRQTLTKLVENKYDVLKRTVMKKISEARNYTLTTDVWSDSNTSKSYLGLTLHYLWRKKIESVTFGVEPLTDAHTSAYLSEKIHNICLEWNINIAKVNAAVSDNADNIVKAIKDLFGAAKHIPCFAHTLNLIPHAAMGLNSKKEENVPGIHSLISKVKDIVTFFKRSVKASDELRRLQYANGKIEGTALRLIQDVSTRWNSTCLMLQRFLALSDLVGLALLKFPQGPPMVSGAELATIGVIVQILAPIMQATVELSAEKTPTTSKVIPVTHLMRQMIAMIEPAGHDQTSKRLKDFVIEGLNKRFGKAEQMRRLAMATMLDPRFKKLHFQSCLATSQTIQFLSTSVKEVIRNRNSEVTARATIVSSATNNTDSQSNDMWSLHDKLLSANPQQDMETDGGIPVELKQYLNRPVVSRQTDPFEAWDALKTEYPHVYEVALDYLPDLATSVPSERLFSEAGLIATELRNRLTGTHLSQLLFLASISETQWSSI